MPRPRMNRCIRGRWRARYYKPQGVPLHQLEEIVLTAEEAEALRLKNIKDLDQTACAQAMNTSQSTFQRILTSAYQKMSHALLEGKAIRIEE